MDEVRVSRLPPYVYTFLLHMYKVIRSLARNSGFKWQNMHGTGALRLTQKIVHICSGDVHLKRLVSLIVEVTSHN